MKASDISDATVDAFGSAKAFATNLIQPTVRLGVTGLARAGKTVFITSLIHNLMTSGRMPFFDAAAEARIGRIYLEPQPDDAVPRFNYEQHIADLTGSERRWPQSTRALSQVRITIEYEPQGFWKRQLGHDRLHVDIVDYPGEWLLDLPLLDLSFEEWSQAAITRAQAPKRSSHAKAFLALLAATDASGAESEEPAQKLAEAFTGYLGACRDAGDILIAGPPGRFLMPGDLAGSPALTFAPLRKPDAPGENALWSMMERRYEAYKTHVIKPFFREHFAKLDRQIVLVDALSALNTGAEALGDLEAALREILASFRPGANSWLSAVLKRRISRIVFAATKADHLHHTSHNRLEAILARLTSKAIGRAEFAGADVKVLALAAIRTTREGEASRGRETLPCILGYPMKGETIGAKTFGGDEEYAIFPGDLPEDPEDAFRTVKKSKGGLGLHFVRFRPPLIETGPSGAQTAIPHIRLDRALNFLIGDRLA